MRRTDLYAIPEKIKTARLRAKITGAELAEKSGVCICTVYGIENKPKAVSWKTARRIAEALNLADVYECFGTAREGV